MTKTLVHRHLLAVAGAVYFSTGLAAPAAYAQSTATFPVCNSSSSDPDGDGWGWENDASCLVDNTSSTTDPDNTGGNTGSTTPDGNSGIPACLLASSDPDGDGWGWDGTRSCVITDPYAEVPCIDTDGDGWGWQAPEGHPGRTCLID